MQNWIVWKGISNIHAELRRPKWKAEEVGGPCVLWIFASVDFEHEWPHTNWYEQIRIRLYKS